MPELTITPNGSSLLVKSGAPINTIRYFASTTELETGFDFEAKFV